MFVGEISMKKRTLRRHQKFLRRDGKFDLNFYFIIF